MWSTDDFQQLDDAYKALSEALKHADNPAEAEHFCTFYGTRIGMAQQRLIDEKLLERRAQQIARFQREHPPMGRNPATRIPYFDKEDARQAA